MTVPIGISFGDLVAGAKLVQTVGKALKDSGGADEDFQYNVRRLEAIAAVFEAASQCDAIAGNATYLNPIRGQAQSMQPVIDNFLSGLKNYERSLGATASNEPHRKAVDRVRWATSKSKQVELLCQKVLPALWSLEMLLSLNASKTLTALDSRSVRILELQQQQSHDVRRSASDLRKDVRDTLDQKMTSMEGLMMSLHKENKISLSHLRRDVLNLSSPDDHELGAVELMNTGTKQLLQGMVLMLARLWEVMRGSLPRVMAVLSQLAMYFRVMQMIPQSMSLLLTDNILLMDVLGDKHSIPFQHVRSWKIFRSMLETRFENRPGWDKVVAGHFRIMRSNREDES